MKKIGFFAIFLALTSLSGCGGYKVPTTSFEKVRAAFNGVAKSFKSPKLEARKAINLEANALRAVNIPFGLEKLSRLYTNDDRDNNSLEDITYNQPPMTQFQCLKRAYEKIGSEYKFDTKYFDDITGSIYLDLATGKEADKKEENKVNFTFGLALDISIDDTDLITADVEFLIELTKGSEVYKDNWYVKMELKYDMEDADPTYTLAMYTSNDHSRLPYSKTNSNFVYEYDYVDMNKGRIHEWRKFVFSTSKLVTKDAEHQTFDSYANEEGFEYRADTARWYHDGQGYKFMQNGGTKEASAAAIFFEDIGLNSTDINPDSFEGKQGERNSVMQDLYKEFTKQVKRELVLELVEAGEGNSHGNPNDIAGIAVMNQDLSGRFDGYSCPNMAIIDIFNGYQDEYEHILVKPRVVYVNADGGYISDVSDVRTLNLYFGVPSLTGVSEYNAVPIGYNETIKSGYENLQILAHTQIADRTFAILVHDADRNLFGEFQMNYTGDLPEFDPGENPDKK